MNRNMTIGLLAVTLLFASIAASEASADCSTCQTTNPAPQTYTTYQPVTQPAYVTPAPRTPWYPGKLIGQWIAGRRTYRTSFASYGATCYRPVTRAVPITTYQAVTSCDPCTGCPTTTYRPVTVMGTQTCYVPQRAYRQVLYRALSPGSWLRSGCCSPAVSTAACCSDPGGSCSSGATGGSMYSSPDSGCCSASPSTPIYSSPSTPTYSGGETTPRPTLDGNGPTSAYKPAEEPDEPPDELPLEPTPDPSSTETNSTGFEAPKLVDPRERTADLGPAKVRTAIYREPVKPRFVRDPKPVKKSQVHRDAGGWHSVPRDR